MFTYKLVLHPSHRYLCASEEVEQAPKWETDTCTFSFSYWCKNSIFNGKLDSAASCGMERIKVKQHFSVKVSQICIWSFFLKDLYLIRKYSNLYVCLFAYKDFTGTYTEWVRANSPGIRQRVKQTFLPMLTSLLHSRTCLTLQQDLMLCSIILLFSPLKDLRFNFTSISNTVLPSCGLKGEWDHSIRPYTAQKGTTKRLPEPWSWNGVHKVTWKARAARTVRSSTFLSFFFLRNFHFSVQAD